MAAVATARAHEETASDEEALTNQYSRHHMSDKVPAAVRAAFIRKVYTLLVVMLFVTSAIAAPFQALSKEQVIENKLILSGLAFSSLLITVAMNCCCLGTLTLYPMNYAFLAVLSVLYGFVVGAIATTYTLPSVLLAAGMTAGIFTFLTIYACTTKSDFTGAGPYLITALFGLIVFGIVTLIVGMFCASCYKTMHLVYGGIGAVLSSFFIVYHTQLIVGGHHTSYKFWVDDYAFAAAILYMDIINLFLRLLGLVGERK